MSVIKKNQLPVRRIMQHRRRQEAQIVKPRLVPASACEDKDALPILGAAVAGGADCIVTGDKHPLKLVRFSGIPILSPRMLYDRLQ